MKKIFVVTDVHGFYTELINALVIKGFDIGNEDHILLSCGDEFDRGPQAREMLSFLTEMDRLERLILVRGNHTDLLINCLSGIRTYKRVLGAHHYSNGTVDTIAQIVNDEIISQKLRITAKLTDKEVQVIEEKTRPLLDLLNKAYNFCEIEDFVFVHGWIPVDTDGNIKSKWRHSKAQDWEQARWYNGMAYNHSNGGILGKTVVCGHWHCSYGWSYIKQEREEFPQKNHMGWEKSFEPYTEDGLIALDACTAYSGIINVLVIEITLK